MADTRQFVRLTNNQWVAPGGSPAMLDIIGSRTPFIETGCNLAPGPRPQNRGWGHGGMALRVTSPQGDVQIFQHKHIVVTLEKENCYVQQGFRLTDWQFRQGVTLSLSYAAVNNLPNAPQDLVSVSNNLGRSIRFVRSGLGGFDNGLTGADRRAVSIGFAPCNDNPPHPVTCGGQRHTGPDGQAYDFMVGVVANRYRLREVYRPVAPSTPFVRYGYDSQHRVVQVEDAGAVAGTRQPYRFHYAAGLGGARIDPLGGRYDVTYDRDGHLRRVVDELGHVTQASADGRGRVIEYRYPLREKQLFTYDRRNNTTSMTRVARPGVLPALLDTRVQVQWHPQLNKPTKVTDARLAVTELAYNASTGLLESLTQPGFTPHGEGAARRPVTTFLYDSFGRLTRATDPTGMATRYDYSPTNETLITQVVDDGAAPRLNLTTSFTYDAEGNLTGVVTPRGAVVQAEYNARRQPFYEQSLAGATAIAPQTAATLLARTDWVYDAVGRVEQEKRSSDVPGVPYAITSTLYTATDQPYSVTDPLGRVTVTDYDSLDRPHRVTDPLGRVSEVLYNAGGQKMVEKSAVGTGLEQNSARYLYNPDGSIATITDPRDNILTHGYDAHGRLSLLSYADGKSERYAYDANDNRTGFTQRDGTISTTTYDSLNRPTRITRPGLAETSYGLDILGRVVAERAGAVTVRTHAYDTAGRKQSVNVTLPRPATGVTGATPSVAMSFTYDASGNRTGATWSGGTVTWVHDGLNRIRQVSFGAEMVTAHAYDLLGRRTGTNRGPGANSAYAYDISGQLTGASHAWNGGTLNTAYGYDAAGQLTSEVPDNLSFLWQPAATLAKTTNYDPASPINALTKIDGINQPYDARGNRLAASGKTYRYDTRNMLVGASAPGQTVSYGYYPEGGRAWKQVNGVTTLYLEVDGVEWGTYDAAGTLKERTIRASGTGGAVIATYSNAGLIRLLPNRQGSVIGWLRPDGKLGGAYTYDAYGNSPQAGAGGPQYRYAGMRLDAETGLYHTPFRAYDPVDGRWMQLDPAGLVDGLNRYAYVKNSPLMGVDPTGLFCNSFNYSSNFCNRSQLFAMLASDSTVKNKTTFFNAASIVNEAFGSMDIILSDIFVSSQSQNLIRQLNSTVEYNNLNAFSLIRRGEMLASNNVEVNDRAMVRFEQGIVQNFLDALKSVNPNAYDDLVSDVNSSLNSYSLGNFASSITDSAYSRVLDDVRKDLGRDIDFGSMDDRVAVGDALTSAIRNNSKIVCTGSRIKRESC